ncbi:MAG: hypothetical protein JJ975_08580 [Bacteroidia bacterium]|nr:hypothetical protein [Bacteroidia bacterium]
MTTSSKTVTSGADISPVRVGTMHVLAQGNHEQDFNDAHYVLTAVDLPQSAGEISFELDPFTTDDDTIKYSFQYPYDLPIDPSTIRTYTLPIFLPKKDENGGVYLPQSVEVYNKDNPDEKKTGKVQIPDPVIDEKEPGRQFVDVSCIEPDDPRPRAIMTTVKQPDSSNMFFYFVFVISLTNKNNKRLLELTSIVNNTFTLAYSIDGDSDNPPNRASVALLPTDNTYQTTKVEIVGGRIANINFDPDQIKSFYYEDV